MSEQETQIYFEDEEPAMRCMMKLQRQDFYSGRAMALQCPGATDKKPDYGFRLVFCGDGFWMVVGVDRKKPVCPWSTNLRSGTDAKQDSTSSDKLSSPMILLIVVLAMILIGGGVYCFSKM